VTMMFNEVCFSAIVKIRTLTHWTPRETVRVTDLASSLTPVPSARQSLT
jgi:hypothetical protein